MFGSSPSGAQAYAKVGVETGVSAASPHKLIAMLFDGAIVAVHSALEYMKAGEIARKGSAISKAIMIIDSGLRASLNKSVGGEIALNLDALYEYMSDRLLQANLQNKPEILEEVLVLLRDLMSAWDTIPGNFARPDVTLANQQDNANKSSVISYDGLTPRSTNYVSA